MTDSEVSIASVGGRSIYLDHAAATPLDAGVFEAMRPCFTDNFYNPSAIYLSARSVSSDLAEARSRVSRILGVRPAEIVFTAGGTEANNLAIHGVMGAAIEGIDKFSLGDTGHNGDQGHENDSLTADDLHIVASSVEHESVLKSVEKYNHSLAPVLEDGRVDVGTLKGLIKDTTILVSVMYVNNELGTVMPIAKIANAIEEVKANRLAAGNNIPLYFHTDAAQAPLFFDLQVKKLGVDMATLNGGKIYGPKQTGALYVSSSVHVDAQIVGGGQEYGKRSGTENVAGVIGLSLALDKASKRRHSTYKKLSSIQQYFYKQLEQHIPEAQINGSIKYRTPNNIHITIPGIDNERVMMELDELGIMCAVGSACSASSDEPSHVLRAIGMNDVDAQSSLRFTTGRSNTTEDIKYVVLSLKNLLNKQ